jgi:hypothetical protein
MSKSIFTPSLSRIALVLAVGALALTGCDKGEDGAKGKGKQRQVKMKMGDKPVGEGSVTAKVATFDPNADIVLDLDKYGSERPDEYRVQQAFFDRFGALDECVWAEKDRRGSEKQLKGDVSMSIKLNPESARPFAVNATMPKKFKKNQKLSDCLREAGASSEFPTYDGPPVVVDFEFELDPGSDWVEE